MPPSICCSTTSYGALGARAAIENVREVGLEAIELPIPTAGARSRYHDEPLLTSESGSNDVAELKRLLAVNGVRIASCLITSGNPLDPENLRSILRKLDLMHQLGVPLAVGGAGAARDEGERQQLYRHLRQIGDYAAERGIVYCCDTLPGVCLNHRWMLQTMAELDHPHLRINFDPGNLLYYNENPTVEVSLAKVCHLVRHVHLKDSMGEMRQWYFPALGYGGAVDFLRIRELLRDVGYDGPCSLCIDGIDEEGALPLEEYQRRIADSLRTLRDCGWLV